MDETEINYNDFLLLQDSIDSIEINNILQSIGSNVNISQSDSQAEFTNGFSQITVDSNPVSSDSNISPFLQLPSIYHIILPTICEIIPSKASDVKNCCTIKVNILNVMTIPIRDTKQQVFYVQMVTPVYEMDPQQRIQYLKYKEIKYQNTKGKKKAPPKDYHCKFWTTMRWLAKLTGVSNLDDVRIRIRNRLHLDQQPSFRYFPFDPSKIYWNKIPSKEGLENCNPKLFGYIQTRKEKNLSGGIAYTYMIEPNIINNPPELPEIFTKRAGTEILNPSYPDGNYYNSWTIKELLNYDPMNTSMVVKNSTDNKLDSPAPARRIASSI